MKTKTESAPAISTDSAQASAERTAPRGMRIKTKIRAGGNNKGGSYFGNN